MSLLMNEDFSIYQLRLAYLNQIHDGVGERLISLNTAVLNDPAFRAAGWHPDTGAIKRCYSPPIPTAVTAEYFQAPPRSARRERFGVEDEDGEVTGGLVTGHRGSGEILGPKGLSERKRTRRRELEEDDSSDLSDDSDEEEKRAAQQIKFSKMPVRPRSDSSPGKSSTLRPGPDGPELTITSPSRPPESGGLRRGSLGAVEAVKQRARRDTATSSELSSENEPDPAAFRRQKIPSRPRKSHEEMLRSRIEEEEQERGTADSDLEDEDVGEASDLSDEFEGTVESGSLLGIGNGLLVGVSDELDPSPIKPPPDVLPTITTLNLSPRKTARHDILPKLPRLPPNRPKSTVQPVSILSRMLKGQDPSNENPFQRFADLSGKGEASPLWIKICAPFSENSSKSFEVPLRRQKEGANVTVAELIGLALWRYNEEEYQPPLKPGEESLNRWTLRMVEDEEVDFDFPALGRFRPVTDFTSNNNRPPNRRARDKPWDEFALVKATEEQYHENEEFTPQVGQDAPPSGVPTPKLDAMRAPTPAPMMQRTDSDQASAAPSVMASRNPITGPSFAPSALRKDSQNLLDQPQQSVSHATPRTGAAKTVSVHFTDPHSFQTTLFSMPTASDTYIAELFDMACKRFNLDKALHVLKVSGTQTVAPSDRTVEALGERLHLDLVRRRFGGGDAFGIGLSGSPGSTSPNAPLLLATGTTPTKKKKGFGLHPLTTKSSDPSTIPFPPFAGLPGTTSTALLGGGKRYNVIRKQPLSFAQNHPRTLVIDSEYMQILPAAAQQASVTAPAGKTTNVHMSAIVGVKVSRKHAKMVRVLVYRERETKRYDFEAGSREEAKEIVGEIRKGVAPFAGGDD